MSSDESEKTYFGSEGSKICISLVYSTRRNYSQIAAYCDVILRKLDDMIISLTVLSVRDDTREVDSRNMRYRDNSWPSLGESLSIDCRFG